MDLFILFYNILITGFSMFNKIEELKIQIAFGALMLVCLSFLVTENALVQVVFIVYSEKKFVIDKFLQLFESSYKKVVDQNKRELLYVLKIIKVYVFVCFLLILGKLHDFVFAL